MQDEAKTKEQLLAELHSLRMRIAQFEKDQEEYRRAGELLGKSRTIVFYKDITERKRNEEILGRYELLAQNSRDIILFLEYDSGRILEANAAAVKAYGYSREELLELTISDLRMPAEKPLIREQMAIANVDGVLFETVHVRGDGSTFPVEVSSRGETIGTTRTLISIIRDITERKLIEDTRSFLVHAGWTASGEDFFKALARYLGRSLGIDYVCIDQLEGDGLSARTLAVYFDGEFEDNLTYTLRDTPCGTVVERNKICSFARGVRHLFPNDTVLQDMEAESYVGTVLWDSRGKQIGLIALIGRKPLSIAGLAESVLQIVAVRAAGELERMGAEEALRRSRLDLDRAQSIGQIGSWRLDIGRDLLTWSDETHRIFGVPKGTPLSYESFLKLVHRDDRQYVYTKWGEALGGEPYDIEHRILVDGQVKWVREKAYLEFANAGELLGGFGITQDITDRKMAEEACARLAAIVESSGDAIISTTPDGVITTWNSGAERLYGYRAEEIIGQSISVLIPEGTTDDLPKILRKIRNLETIEYHETLRRRKDGEMIHVSLSVSPVKDLSGSISGISTIARDITECKRAEAALRLSEEKFAGAFSNNPAAIAMTDLEKGLLLEVNETWEMLTGYSREEVVGRNAGQTGIWPSSDAWACFVQKLREEGQLRGWEQELLKKSGETFVAEISAQILILLGEKVILSTMVDITKRKMAESILNARSTLLECASSHSVDELLQKAVDVISGATGSPIGFLHFLSEDQETLQLQTWSTRTIAEFCKADGKGSHYPISQAGVWGDCVRERRPVMHNDYTALMHGKGLPEGHAPVARELVIPIMRGERMVAVLGVGNKPGNYTVHDVELVSHLADMAWEIAMRQITQQELLRKNVFARTILDTIDALIIVVDRQGRITQFNGACESTTGWTSVEVTGRCVWEFLIPEEECEGIKAVFEQLSAGMFPKRHINQWVTRDGSRVWISWANSVLLDDAGKVEYFVGTGIDITVQRITQEALQESRDQLEERVRERTVELQVSNKALMEHASKLERLNQELEDFTFVASHDLQEPLRKIRTFADMLLRDHKDNLAVQAQEHLLRITRSVKRMSDSVRSLLDYSRATSKYNRFEPVDLGLIARDVVNDLELTIIESGGIVQIEEMPTIEADSVQIRHLLQNLIHNSIKYRKESESPVVKVSGQRSGTTCWIFVEDNGIGFERPYLEKIFKPFQQLHPRNRFEGTGMGLALCRKIVERHNGSMTARSTPGIGSTFIVQLPTKHARREGAQ